MGANAIQFLGECIERLREGKLTDGSAESRMSSTSLVGLVGPLARRIRGESNVKRKIPFRFHGWLHNGMGITRSKKRVGFETWPRRERESAFLNR